ncbi:hypothetical protein [Actinomadura rubrobrunea]|uniref:hypothetical protein n=1 Tax=Actinomadura rubrobrunea TaxID=115335 RepID=UPI001D046DDA|nr:hypothetical protein [Actinomadura rubrobrunea]
MTGRPVWRLLLRGLGVYLPGWQAPRGVMRVRNGAGPSADGRPSRGDGGAPGSGDPSGFGPPGFVDGATGFGLHLPRRARGLEPDREIYVRGRQDPSFGIVIAGPSEAIGTRVVDAEGLLRYARRLTFQELYDTADAASVPYAVRAARAVDNVVFLDRATGVGLCAEVDPVTGDAACPLFVRLHAADRTVRAYGLDGAVTSPRPTG